MLSRYAVLAFASLVSSVAAAEFPVPSVELGCKASAIHPYELSGCATAQTVPHQATGCGASWIHSSERSEGVRGGTRRSVPPNPVARLVWLDPSGIAFGTEAVVRPAVAELLREMGVATSWRRGDPHELARPGEVRVIFLNRAAQREHGVPVLGATPSTFLGEPFVWVHVPGVCAATGVAASRTGASLDVHSARRLGIGLARVIAHEVVHALVPALPHGKGLMSARLDRRMLTAASIAVEPEVSLAVRAALLGAPAVVPAADAILAAESKGEEPYR